MSTSNSGTDSRKGDYHHGDLRQALLRAAEQILQEEGLEGLSLRAVARKAGVSHTAPYRHFPDKDALIAAIATGGLIALCLAMRKGAECGDDAADRLQETGIAYVCFGLENPALYRLLFGPALLDRSRYPDLEQAGLQAYDVCRQQVAACLAAREPDGAASSELLEPSTIALWSLVHGLCSLMLDGAVGTAQKRAEGQAGDVTADDLTLVRTVLAAFATTGMMSPAGGQEK